MIVVLAFLLCIFASCSAVEETFAHDSADNDARLILGIIKRVGDSSFGDAPDSPKEPNGDTGSMMSKQTAATDELQPPVGTACEAVIHQGSIIKVTESVNAGADYIDSIKNVKSHADCQQYCCHTSTCDVAVYQDKGDRYCYLFKCAGRCTFKSHSGYFISTFTSRQVSEQPEEDLQSLNSKSPTHGEEKQGNVFAAQNIAEKKEIASSVVEETTRSTAPTTQTQEPELVIAPHSVGLSEFCTEDRHCEEPLAVCRQGRCACKDDYYNKEGLCRKVCPPSSFECFHLGTFIRGPECVAESQVCDSYLHCADGSDEFNCRKIDLPSGMRLPRPGSLDTDQESKVVTQSLTANYKSSNIQNSVHMENVQDIKPTPDHTIPLTTSRTEASSAPSSTTSTVKPSSKDEDGNKHVFLATEKVTIASAPGGAEGLIIALSLGLVFTVILLMLVGCRLRRVRHRLRKDKSLHHNDADYLINGMYL